MPSLLCRDIASRFEALRYPPFDSSAEVGRLPNAFFLEQTPFDDYFVCLKENI